MAYDEHIWGDYREQIQHISYRFGMCPVPRPDSDGIVSERDDTPKSYKQALSELIEICEKCKLCGYNYLKTTNEDDCGELGPKYYLLEKVTQKLVETCKKIKEWSAFEESDAYRAALNIIAKRLIAICLKAVDIKEEMTSLYEQIRSTKFQKLTTDLNIELTALLEEMQGGN